MANTPVKLDALASTMKVLADPTRLRLFEILLSGQHCNCELGQLSGLSNNLVSHHLRVLTDAGLIQSRRDADDARWIYFSVDRSQTEKFMEQLVLFLHPQTTAPREPNCSPRKNLALRGAKNE